VVGTLGAIFAATGTALLGHPAGTTLFATAVGAVHVLAAGAWAGGVMAAALALVPDLRARPDRAEHVAAMLRSFGALAVTCVTALAATGLLLTAAQVSTVDGLLTTPYGLILLAKVALVGLAGLLGLRMTTRLRRRDSVPNGRGVTAEATALVLVLLLAGTLAAAGPAKGPRFPVGGAVASAPEVSGQVADLIDTVTIRPNRPGRNVVTIVVSDTRRPAPAPFSGVTVSLSGPDGTRKVHPVTRGAEGWTLTVDDIRTAGDWNVAVTVMRNGLSPVTSVHNWAVPHSGQTAPVVVSSAALQPWLTILAGVGTAAVVIGALVLALRRRRRVAAVP
jgi:copper transport protein